MQIESIQSVTNCKPLVLSGLFCMVLSLGIPPARSAEPAFRLLGSQTCSSSACHGSAPDASRTPHTREAFIRWVQSDPHARAHETLVSDRYQQILTRVSNRDEGGVDPQVQSRCAQCHDPQGLSNPTSAHSSFTKGIGCESCHGPAEKWLTRHYERDITRDELASLGMTDTKSFLARAAACARCHVGSATQDMNHDMIAAGHPPLRFELAAYHDLIPHKHWNDTRPRLDVRDYQVKLWAAGQNANAEASLELLKARCQKGAEHWPEFAEYDCFRCHQRLRPPQTAVPRGNKGGLPNASRWHFVFATSPSEIDLRNLLQANFAGDSSSILAAAADASRELKTNHRLSADLSARQLVAKVSRSLDSDESPQTEWETRCQQFLALVAAERSYRDELARQQLFSRLNSTDLHFRLSEEKTLLADLAHVRAWLQFESGPAKTVLIDEPILFQQHRDEIGPQLRRIAEQLQQRIGQLP